MSGQDPTRSFAQLRDVEIPQERLDELSARIADAIDREQPIVVSQRTPKRWRWAASIAASILLCSLLAIPLATHQLDEPLWVKPVVPLMPLEEATAGIQVEATSIELISSPGEAQTLDLELGQARVLMIFDESIDL